MNAIIFDTYWKYIHFVVGFTVYVTYAWCSNMNCWIQAHTHTQSFLIPGLFIIFVGVICKLWYCSKNVLGGNKCTKAEMCNILRITGSTHPLHNDNNKKKRAYKILLRTLKFVCWFHNMVYDLNCIRKMLLGTFVSWHPNHSIRWGKKRMLENFKINYNKNKFSLEEICCCLSGYLCQKYGKSLGYGLLPTRTYGLFLLQVILSIRIMS